MLLITTKPTKEELNKKHIDKLFLWAFAWSVGGTLSSDESDRFEKVMAETFPVDSLPRGSTFDFMVSITHNNDKLDIEYTPWDEVIPPFQYNNTMSYFEMVVPTKQTTSYGWFLNASIQASYPIFITGLTGTGKTILINAALQSIQHTITLLSMTFSAKTSAYSTQLTLEAKLQT